METIKICVERKVAVAESPVVYVCGNSDYQLAFAFDEEWENYPEKTARFHYRDVRRKEDIYQDVIFHGDCCPVPVIFDARIIRVGVFAGNLHTTTKAVILAKRSVLCGGGSPAAPTEDVYAQIMELLNRRGPGSGLPTGGRTGQVLYKKSDEDYDTAWGDVVIPEQYGLVTYDQDKTITIT